MSYKVETVERTTTEITEIASFDIQIVSMIMFVNVTLSITTYDENNVYSETVNMTLSGDDYTNWGNDDNYLVDYVVEKLGLTLIVSV